MRKGLVAIVGRPNVGKSTLFNRLTRSTRAIVDDRAGVTRDRIYGEVRKEYPSEHWDYFHVIDTGGFETKDLYFQPFKKNIVWEQTSYAIEEADVIVLVLDAKSGAHPHDAHLVNYVKKFNKPVIYVVNKIDGKEQDAFSWEFYELGIEKFLPISAAHNRNVWELSVEIENRLSQLPHLAKSGEPKEDEVKFCLIGKPNVGKSSILNRLVGKDRSLVSDVAGTTRDTVDSIINFEQKRYVIVDTAGIRRKTKIDDKIESLSVLRSIRTMEQCDVVVLVITPDGISDQDARLASLAVSNFKPLLIVVNKWDLKKDKDSKSMNEFADDIKYKLKDMDYVQILFTSCLENKRVHKILANIAMLAESYRQRISTSKINECLQEAVNRHTPALIRQYNKRVKFYYATQVRTSPPTIVIKCNVAGEIQESYKRYLTKQFRRRLDYGAIPIRILYRNKSTKEEKSQRA